MQTKTKKTRTVFWLCVTAMFMALNVVMSSFSISVPGGHLDPLAAFLVGGVGAFLGDLLFYPTPMFVSLVTHGLQAVVISVFAHHVWKSTRPRPPAWG